MNCWCAFDGVTGGWAVGSLMMMMMANWSGKNCPTGEAKRKEQGEAQITAIQWMDGCVVQQASNSRY